MLEKEVLYIPATGTWYYELKYYLTHGASSDYLDAIKKRALRLKSASSQWVNGVLFRKNYYGVLLGCLEKDDAERVLERIT